MRSVLRRAQWHLKRTTGVPKRCEPPHLFVRCSTFSTLSDAVSHPLKPSTLGARAGDAHPSFYRANQSDVHSRLHDDLHSDVHNRSVMAVIGGPAVMDELMASHL